MTLTLFLNYIENSAINFEIVVEFIFFKRRKNNDKVFNFKI